MIPLELLIGSGAVDDAELKRKDERLDLVREFRMTVAQRRNAEAGSQVVRMHWERGRPTSAKPLEELRVMTERVLSSRDAVKQILVEESLYHPIVLHHGDGTEARFDPMENLFNQELEYEIRDFFDEAIAALEAKLPSFTERLQHNTKLSLEQLEVGRPKPVARDALSNLEQLGERMKKATPEEWEPLAAKARTENAKLAKRVEELEKRAKQPRAVTIWSKNPWLAPTMILTFLTAALTALAFYVDARIETKLREIGLLVVRNGHDDQQGEPEKEQAQKKPAHLPPAPSVPVVAPAATGP